MARHLSPPSDPVHLLSGPAELLQAIAYMLGFHPTRSLVLVGLRARRYVGTARLDLDDAAPVLRSTLWSLREGGARDVVVALFDDEATMDRAFEPVPWAELTLGVAAAADDAGCRLADVLLVARNRWWSYLCGEPACCPPGGRPLPDAPSAYATAAAVSGVAVLPDRAALVTSLDPDPANAIAPGKLADAERAAVERIVAGDGPRQTRSVKRAIFAATRAEPGPGRLPDAAAARFGVALRDLAIRDAVWLAIDDGVIDGRDLWRELGRRLPPPYAAAPLFLLGWRCWRHGDGALAGIAVERAVDADPGYSAASLLLAALSSGMSPHRVPKLRSSRRRVT